MEIYIFLNTNGFIKNIAIKACFRNSSEKQTTFSYRCLIKEALFLDQISEIEILMDSF